MWKGDKCESRTIKKTVLSEAEKSEKKEPMYFTRCSFELLRRTSVTQKEVFNYYA